MIFIYDLAIRSYVFAIRLSAIFGNQKAQRWLEGRNDWRGKMAAALKQGENRVWFHCSSLGEFEQGRPVMEKLKLHQPGLKIVLTFFSPSGYEVRKNYDGADYVFYLPADTKRNASDFISLVEPKYVFFTKYEYWHHFFHEVKKKEIPLYMISAIFRPGDRFFKWYGGFFRNMLKCVAHFFVQDATSEKLLKGLGFLNCAVTGDTRFDRVVELSKTAKEIPAAKRFSEGNKVIVGGSTWSGDEKLLAEVIKSFSPNLKLIIAPHEISEARIEELKGTFSAFRVTAISVSVNVDPDQYDVLLIDNIGMLSSLYRYGSFAYVGGGFGKGIHNTLEAAVFGIPVFFGPNYEKFNEAKELLQCGGAYSVVTPEALNVRLKIFMDAESERIKSGNASSDYVKSNSGATEKILGKLSL